MKSIYEYADQVDDNIQELLKTIKPKSWHPCLPSTRICAAFLDSLTKIVIKRKDFELDDFKLLACQYAKLYRDYRLKYCLSYDQPFDARTQVDLLERIKKDNLDIKS